MASVEEQQVDGISAERSRKVAALIAGVIFAVLIVGAGSYLDPGEATEFVGGRYQLLLMALFIGISTGHFLGISLGERFTINVAATVGAFVTLSIAFLSVSIPQGLGPSVLFSPGGILVLSTLLLVLGHYSHLIAENHAIDRLIETFAERLSPALLGVIWLFESILPPVINPIIASIGFEEIGATITGGIQLLLAVAGVILFIKIAEILSHSSNR